VHVIVIHIGKSRIETKGYAVKRGFQ